MLGHTAHAVGASRARPAHPAIDLEMQLALQLFSVCVLEQGREGQHSRPEGMNKSKAITPRESVTNQLFFPIEGVLSPVSSRSDGDGSARREKEPPMLELQPGFLRV